MQLAQMQIRRHGSLEKLEAKPNRPFVLKVKVGDILVTGLGEPGLMCKLVRCQASGTQSLPHSSLLQRDWEQLGYRVVS